MKRLLLTAAIFTSLSAHAFSATASCSCDLPDGGAVYVFLKDPAIGMISFGTHFVSYYVSQTNPYVGDGFNLDCVQGTFSGIGPDGQSLSYDHLECGQ